MKGPEGQTAIRMQKKIDPGRFCHINKSLLVLKLYYFFVFSGQACIKPFFPVFFRHVGMSAQQTGIIIGLQPVARLLGAPVFGALADKYRKHKIAMLIMLIVSTTLQFSLLFVRPNEELSLARNLCSNSSFWNKSERESSTGDMRPCGDKINCSVSAVDRNCGNHSVLNMSEMVNTTGNGQNNNDTFLVLIILVFVSSLFDNSNSLADAATVKYLTDIDRGGDYGKQRLWGAVGWGSIAVISGFTIDQSAQHSNQSQFLIAFCGFLLFNILAVMTVFKLPLEYLEGKSKPNIFQNVCTILSDCRIVIFLIAILIMGTCMTTIGAFLFWFLQDINGSHLLMGLSLCMTCVAEVPIMFYSGGLIKWIGHHGVLYLTLVCYTIRYLSYSFIPNAWYVLAIEPLHGVTFGAMWAATTSYGGVISPEGLRATVMGLVTATHFGLGKLIAGLGGGAVYSKYGPRVLFRSLAVTSAVTCLFFVISQKLLKKKSQVNYTQFQSNFEEDINNAWDLEMKEISLDSEDDL
ncbi:hypothetical protein ACROYT_G020665 [Oculina patagonica]